MSDMRKTKCGGCERIVFYDHDQNFCAHKVLCPECAEKMANGELDRITFYGDENPTVSEYGGKFFGQPPEIIQWQTKPRNVQPFYMKFVR